MAELMLDFGIRGGEMEVVVALFTGGRESSEKETRSQLVAVDYNELEESFGFNELEELSGGYQ